MKILYSFTGNICSGKTTISKIISEKRDIDLFSIDEYRIKHNAHLITEEWAAWDELTSDISKKQTAIFESSGLTKNVYNIYNRFDRVIIILLDCSNEELVRRFNERGKSNYKEVPFYLKRNDTSIENIIEGMSDRLTKINPNIIYNSEKMSVEEILKKIETDVFNC